MCSPAGALGWMDGRAAGTHSLGHLPEALLPYQPCITSGSVLIVLFNYFFFLAIMYVLCS